MVLLKITLAVLLLLACTSASEVSYGTPDVVMNHMNIRSDVSRRFASTEVTASMTNTVEEEREVIFSVTLPLTAFISDFSMTIEGELYYGNIEEKAAELSEEISAAESAAKAALDTNIFLMTVNVPANGKANFNLTYQELLVRRVGLYQHVINISPGQIVEDLRVEVIIRDSLAITNLRIPAMRDISNEYQVMSEDDNALAVVEQVSATDVRVSYAPSIQEQIDTRTDGQFIILYDVERELDAVQAANGYFVQSFAPSGREPFAKDISLVIDISGSMRGPKLEQTIEAILAILDDLRPIDRFAIVTFSNEAYVWMELGQFLSEATPDNVLRAKSFVQGLRAGGGTNINAALLETIGRMSAQYELEEITTRFPLIFFLTDGDPTVGITTKSEILSNVEAANRGRFSLFGLGLGYKLDFNFIKQLSLRNGGYARKIHTGSAVTVQLKGFYDEISSPIMSNVRFSYLDDGVDYSTVTKTEFAYLFDGSELIMAGKLMDDVTSLPLMVYGGTAQGNASWSLDIPIPSAERRSRELNSVQYIERLWAYLTIRRLYYLIFITEDQVEKEQLQRQVIELSIKYNFVTPWTSMVITKPPKPNEISGRHPPSDIQLDAGHRFSTYRHTGFADNDPHFVINVDGISEGLCFDVFAEPGAVFQLLHDRVTGITVNSRFVALSSTQKHDKNPKTYLGEIWLQHRGHSVHVTPSSVTVKHRKYKWIDNSITDDRDVVITIVGKKYVDVTYFDNVTFRIMRHVIKHYSSRDPYLGFYIHDGQGLSRATHGLIGQFQFQEAAMVSPPRLNVTSGRYSAKLRLHGPHSGNRLITAYLGHRRDMDAGVRMSCWYARNNGAGLLQGVYSQYVVPKLEYGKIAPGIMKVNKGRNRE